MLISEDNANVANWVCATVSRTKPLETVMERGTDLGVDASLLDDPGLGHVSSVLPTVQRGATIRLRVAENK